MRADGRQCRWTSDALASLHLDPVPKCAMSIALGPYPLGPRTSTALDTRFDITWTWQPSSSAVPAVQDMNI